MQAFTIHKLSIKLNDEAFKRPSLYCLIRSANQMHCSKCTQIGTKWIDIVSELQLELNKSHYLCKIQIWNYDTQLKVGELNVDGADLPHMEHQKQFNVNNRSIQIKLSYSRASTICSPRESHRQASTLRISYNKSDSNIKMNQKANVPLPQRCYKDINNPMEDLASKYTDGNMCGSGNRNEKWKFVSVRNASMNKLKI